MRRFGGCGRVKCVILGFEVRPSRLVWSLSGHYKGISVPVLVSLVVGEEN